MAGVEGGREAQGGCAEEFGFRRVAEVVGPWLGGWHYGRAHPTVPRCSDWGGNACGVLAAFMCRGCLLQNNCPTLPKTRLAFSTFHLTGSSGAGGSTCGAVPIPLQPDAGGDPIAETNGGLVQLKRLWPFGDMPKLLAALSPLCAILSSTCPSFHKLAKLPARTAISARSTNVYCHSTRAYFLTSWRSFA